MTLFEKLQTLFILLAVLVGLALGQLPWVAANAIHLVLPFLLFMLWGVFMQVPLARLAAALKNLRFTGSSLLINFLWTPLLAAGLGWLFLRADPQLRIGLFMLLVTPCTDWYLVFTGLSRGNVALGTSLLPWHLILQLLLLPLYLALFARTVIELDPLPLLGNVLWILLVPLLAATISRAAFRRWRGEQWLRDHFLPRAGLAQHLFLNLAIVAMFASQGDQLLERPDLVLRLLGPLLLFFLINLVLAAIVARLQRFDYGSSAALSLATLARNSPIALAIAVAAFPDYPLIALALVIGPLIELPVLAVVSQGLLWLRASGVYRPDRPAETSGTASEQRLP